MGTAKSEALKEKKCIFCGKLFEPYHRKQVQCGKPKCQIEMQKKLQYKKRRYRIKGHPDIIVTREDLIPLED